MCKKDFATTSSNTVQEVDLTEDQKSALQKFANKHGRIWKMRLSGFWSSGTDAQQQDGALLRQVRNTLGPNWLFSKQNKIKCETV